MQQLRSSAWLWWIMLGVILLIGAVTYFTGYDTDMPLLYENIDERRNLYETYVMRGLSEENLTKPGYPPGILWVYIGAQQAVETVTGETAFEHPGMVVLYVRVAAILTSLLTAFYAALVGRKLMGDIAGLLAAAVWLSLPLVFERTVDGLPQTYEVMFYTAAVYYAILAMEKKSVFWSNISVLVGLFCVIFKYTAFPILGLGVGATLWNLWQQPEKRKIWLRMLGFQFVGIIITAYYLLEIYGVSGLISTDHPETNAFLDSGLGLLLNFDRNLFIFHAGIGQTGLSLLLFVLTFILGTIIYFRLHQEGWKRIGFIFTAGLGLLHLWFASSYVFYIYDTTRYTVPSTSLLVLTQVILIVAIAKWLAKRIKIPQIQYVLVGAVALIWIVPQFQWTWRYTTTRNLENTANGFVDWGANTLPPGDETLILSDSKNFDRGWGGYVGPVRPWVDDDLLERTLSEWDDIYVLYAEITGFRRQALLKTEAGRDILDQMLLVKRLPPPGDEANWRGEYRYIYWLPGYQQETDITFGNMIDVVGYDLNGKSFSAGETITFRPYWQASNHPDRDYQVFLHLTPLDDPTPVNQADTLPTRNPQRTTTTWTDSHEILVGTPMQILISDDVQPGEYRLVIGLYHFETGERLRTTNEQDFAVVTNVTIAQEQVSVSND